MTVLKNTRELVSADELSSDHGERDQRAMDKKCDVLIVIVQKRQQSVVMWVTVTVSSVSIFKQHYFPVTR